MAALEELDAHPDVDVIIIARGGGSLEDLLPFSNEALVRAVHAARTPVVSAIGHEADHPLLDDVADMRASTPTDAAKRIVPDVAEEQRALIGQLRSRATSRLTQRITHDIAQLEQLRSRPVLRSSDPIIEGRAQELWLLLSRGRDTVGRQLDAAARKTSELRASLRALAGGDPRPGVRHRTPRRRCDPARCCRRAGRHGAHHHAKPRLGRRPVGRRDRRGRLSSVTRPGEVCAAS